jgi:hypothetical protein
VIIAISNIVEIYINEWIHKRTTSECTRWVLPLSFSEFVHKCKPIQGTSTYAQMFNHKHAIQPPCAFRLSAFRDRGVPGPTSECRRVPQPRWVEREGEHEGGRARRPQASACLVLVPARPTFSKRALVLPFIGVRKGSRCTMGGVAECYVSSGGELAP